MRAFVILCFPILLHFTPHFLLRKSYFYNKILKLKLNSAKYFSYIRHPQETFSLFKFATLC
jgi:hypothetical protein